MRDGVKSNKRGSRFARQIAQACWDRGFRCKQEVKIARSMYRHDRSIDVVLYGVPSYEQGIAIEARWQQAGGSADEKYVYLVANIKGDYGGAPGYPLPTIVVYGGGGARECANQWLREQVGGKLIKAFTFEEFVCWLNRFDDDMKPSPVPYSEMLRLF